MMSLARQGRPVEKSLSWYLLSLFKWHADTFNAWSHILGFLIFSYFFLLSPLLVSVYTANDADYDITLFSTRVFTLCISLMYASSVLFHVFWPFSEKVCRKCERLEYCCTVLAIAGTGFPFTLLTLQGKTIVHCYWVAIVLVSCPAIYLLSHRVVSTENRISLFIKLMWFIPVIAVHGIAKHGVLGSRMTSVFYPAVASCSLYALGSFLYASQFPEKMCPGKYERFGNSHNIMHGCVLLATLAHWNIFTSNM